MKKISVFLLTCFVGVGSFGQVLKEEMKQLIDENLQFAVTQYKLMAKNTPPDVMPRSFDAAKNELITSNTRWWCSGFYPGTLWQLYGATKDEEIRVEAEKRLQLQEPMKHYTGNHDLGFMIFCPFGTAYEITKNPAYKEVIITAAETLTKRYRPSIKSIQSWDSSSNFRCPVIIDNMMNLELLEWAAQNGGDRKYHEIAVNHSNSTIKNHFRADYSSYHVIDYDLATGTVSRKMTHQGYADESAWARGQSWGLYGFVMMYRFTKDKAYLTQAQKIAKFLLNHPNLPADKVPYWDYNAPDIPNARRDVSAGSIMASALLELGQYTRGKERDEYVNTAATILKSLTSSYRSPAGGNGGFILAHSVGHLVANSEVDVPLTYADYYFVEALLRYKKWYL
jgi:unsaturated chondroitin disaccharide hydrolase